MHWVAPLGSALRFTLILDLEVCLHTASTSALRSLALGLLVFLFCGADQYYLGLR
jgi:hypothetical protein